VTLQPVPPEPASLEPASLRPASRQPASLEPASHRPAAGKPTVAGLGIDLAAQAWHRSGRGDGAIEIAFARGGASGTVSAAEPAAADGSKLAPAGDSEWILMRVAGDPDQRVLVFDRHEWECFLDGARNGEFDAAAAPGPLGPP
jgi:hypothetical protein